MVAYHELSSLLQVEFVVGSRPAPRVSSPLFLPPQKLTLPNFNWIWMSGPLLITILATEGVRLLKCRLLFGTTEPN